MQDTVDKLLSHFDKENEAIRKSKALSSELDGGRRERREGTRPLLSVVTNQVSQRLPDIHHSPNHYSEVVGIRKILTIRNFTDFCFLSLHLQKALKSTSWMDGDGSGSAHTTRFELPMDLKTLEGIVWHTKIYMIAVYQPLSQHHLCPIVSLLWSMLLYIDVS